MVQENLWIRGQRRPNGTRKQERSPSGGRAKPERSTGPRKGHGPLLYKAVEKFAARGSQRVFVGWFFLPGGVYKGDMLIVDPAVRPDATRP